MSANRQVAKGPERTCSKARILTPSKARRDFKSDAIMTSHGLNGWNDLTAALHSSRSNRSNRLHLDSSLIVGNKSVVGAWGFFPTITLPAESIKTFPPCLIARERPFRI